MIASLVTAMLQAAAPAPPLPVPPVERRLEPRPSIITQPDWLRRPSGEEVARFYPPQALRDEVDGGATISCTITAEGLLAGCQVVAESPTGMGFGEAALGLSTLFKMRPMTRDGQAVGGGVVRIPIRFRIPKEAATAMPTDQQARRCYGFAAARLERDPAVPERRVEFFAWRMLMEMKLVSRSLKPSELAREFSGLQATGLRELDDPTLAADRAACEALVKGSPAQLEELLKMGGAATLR